ncbi:hypothetical protein Tco_1089956 [Tanacetum coccineum]|uniref:Uncharacterized protein n=1 Tax=Tanacetum coccineum TaxID=301880 RepID=A0ABQ5I301_9ASTR
MYKERVRILENINKDNNYLNEFLEADERAKRYNKQAQSQLVRDRDIIRDLEKQRDKLDLDVKNYKRKNEELQKTHSILKRQMSEKEDTYHDTILDLEAKLKKNVDLILKLGNSLQGMFMLGPKPLSVYDQQLKHGLGILKEMKDVFESTESELDELEKQNDLLKDQLLEASLKHDVELCVLLNHECVDKILSDELDQVKKKSFEIQEGLQSRIKILEKDVQRCQKQKRDNVKLEYQKLFNSIKKTRSQTQTEMDELIAHVSEKTYAYGAIRAENQNLLFIISELKTRLANVEKGKSVNTKFDKTNGMNAASSVRRPMNKDSYVKNSVLANTKKPAKKVAVHVRKK